MMMMMLETKKTEGDAHVPFLFLLHVRRSPQLLLATFSPWCVDAPPPLRVCVCMSRSRVRESVRGPAIGCVARGCLFLTGFERKREEKPPNPNTHAFFSPTAPFLQQGEGDDLVAEAPKKRTFRKFSYRGTDLDQLLDMKTDKLVELFRARIRRR